MSISLGTKTVELKQVDRTLQVVIDTPISGNYTLQILRHLIDMNTGQQLSGDGPYLFTVAEMLADPDLAALVASLPAILDRLVTAKRAAAAAAIAAAAAQVAAAIAAEAAAVEAARAAAEAAAADQGE